MSEGNGDSGDWDVDAFLDGYKRRTATVTIYQRGDLIDDHARLEAELLRAAGDEDVDRAKVVIDEIKAAETELEGSGRVFFVEACSHEDWYRLAAEHPPSEDERKARPDSEWSADFQAHAVALCVRRPKVTVTQARRMRTDMRPDDFGRLWIAVVECVLGQVEVPKSELATVAASLFAEHSKLPGNRAQRRRSSMAGSGGRSRSTSTTRKAG